MRGFDRAAQVRDKATMTSQLVRGLLKKALDLRWDIRAAHYGLAIQRERSACSFAAAAAIAG
jgi:hypothetical protein